MSRPVLARALALFALLCGVAQAAVKNETRYDVLSAELGLAMPTGAGVRVGQVEGLSGGGYLPDVAFPAPPTVAEFVGKSIFAQTGGSVVSGHATGVGRNFYGSTTSIAPGITEIESYDAGGWLGAYVNASSGSSALPLAPTARVFNHSWVGAAVDNTSHLNILHRVDYLIETYDVIHVAGVNNGSSGTNYPLMSHSMNAIRVGRTDGNHVAGVTDLSDPDGLYVVGRNSPDLVAPRPTTSQATPVVAASAALLVETSMAHPEFSNGSYMVNGQTIYHAGTSEVIKAALMAGARREDVSSYVVGTQNGLSTVYGAGEVDIYNSYHILAGGEQDGGDPLDAPVVIGEFGFDYDDSFANDDVAWYHVSSASALAVTLVWNIDIAGGTTVFDPTAELANFDLALYRLDGDEATLVASSTSDIDSSETIWITGLDHSAQYRIEVLRDDELGAHDYGLAWRTVAAPEPSSGTMLALGGLAALSTLACRWYRSRKSAARRAHASV